MKYIYNNIIPPRGYKAITIYPFVFVQKGKTMKEKDIMHEEIHGRQYKEMLLIGFLFWYAVEFLIKLCIVRNWHRAYRSISLEHEAYVNQWDNRYLKTSKHFAWINYIKYIEQ